MLDAPVKTLPSSDYHDPAVFERELRNVFSNEWICIGRSSDWESPGSFRRITVAGQQFIVVRNREARLRGFHNVCRHRGSALCDTESGRFPAGRIVCPYHAWAYDLDGRLLKTTPLPDGYDMDLDRLSLYPVALDSWGGFVFANLAPEPRTALMDDIRAEAAFLENWPLESLVVAHRESHDVRCNWKVFWENFLECLHCPGVHPDLCGLVPLYGRGVVSVEDLPASDPLRDAPGLRAGARTWSADGEPSLPAIPGLSDENRAAGMTFTTLIPTMFVVGHVDYVRSVRVTPVGPERTALTVDWLVMPEALASGDPDIQHLTGFARQVVLEDARVCELNQQGLRNRAHREGVLMPQEYDVARFHQWLARRMTD